MVVVVVTVVVDAPARVVTGGAMSKRRSAYCMIFEKTGAATVPP